MSNLNPQQFTLITQHGADKKVKRTRFSDYDAAVAHGEAHNPDSDPTMVPQIDQKHSDHPDYEKGLYWFGNRYGVILNKRS